MSKVLVIAWVENTGVRNTGRLRRIDGYNWGAETEACPEAKACVWSRDLADRPRAEAHAAANGAMVLELEDTDDVLAVARATALKAATTAAGNG